MKPAPSLLMQLGPPIVVVVAAIAVTTAIQGYHTERFVSLTDSDELREMAERLVHVPLQFGNWQGKIIEPTDDLLEQYRIAKVNGYTNIVYVNSRTRKQVHVSLVCGHRRHVSIHTPDQCYVGAGYKKIGYDQQELVITPDGWGSTTTVEVKTQQFMLDDPTKTINQRMIWCWSADGEWIAPETGRIGLTREPAWYKLYVTVYLEGRRTSTNIDDHKEFMRDFIPALNVVLFPPEEPEPVAAGEAGEADPNTLVPPASEETSFAS